MQVRDRKKEHERERWRGGEIERGYIICAERVKEERKRFYVAEGKSSKARKIMQKGHKRNTQGKKGKV